MQEIFMLILISLNNCEKFCNFLTLKQARAEVQPFLGPKSASASAANFDERITAVTLYDANDTFEYFFNFFSRKCRKYQFCKKNFDEYFRFQIKIMNQRIDKQDI